MTGQQGLGREQRVKNETENAGRRHTGERFRRGSRSTHQCAVRGRLLLRLQDCNRLAGRYGVEDVLQIAGQARARRMRRSTTRAKGHGAGQILTGEAEKVAAIPKFTQTKIDFSFGFYSPFEGEPPTTLSPSGCVMQAIANSLSPNCSTWKSQKCGPTCTLHIWR